MDDGGRDAGAELLRVLGEPDAIFTPNATDVLKEYLKLGKVGAFFCLLCASHNRVTGARGRRARAHVGLPRLR
jgi:hypothetical protein